MVLGVESIDAEQAKATLHVLLKYQRHRARGQGAGRGGGPGLRDGRARRPHRVRRPSCAPPGLPVSLTEYIDAAEAVTHIPLEDREALKYALAATLVKTSAHWRAFETAFEVYFSMRGPQYGIGEDERAGADGDGRRRGRRPGPGRGRGQGGGGRGNDARGAGRLLLQAAAVGANEARSPPSPARPWPLRRHGGRAARRRHLLPVPDPRGTSTSTACSSGWSTRHGPDGVAGRHADRWRRLTGTLTPLEERLLRDEYKSRIDQLRRELEDEIRRRLVADRGTEALARSLRKPLPEEIDFMHATRDELASLRRAIHPLTRKLAVRLARKRRHGRKGPLDFRSTMRHSLSTGGVPVDPKFRYPRPAKPEIIVIADISGSVASFARFTLHLVHAISSQFSKVRSFVFIDGIDEVTGSSRTSTTWPTPCTGSTPRPTWCGSTATPTTGTPCRCSGSGGARRSRRDERLAARRRPQQLPRLPSLGDPGDTVPGPARVLAQPRAPRYWGTGDSILGEYAVHCDDVFECRNLRQLEHFVTELA